MNRVTALIPSGSVCNVHFQKIYQKL